MAAFFKEAFQYLARQLVLGLIDDLVDWLRERLRNLLALQPGEQVALAAGDDEDVITVAAEDRGNPPNQRRQRRKDAVSKRL